MTSAAKAKAIEASPTAPPPSYAEAVGCISIDSQQDCYRTIEKPEQSFFGNKPKYHQHPVDKFNAECVNEKYNDAAKLLIEASYQSSVDPQKLHELWGTLGKHASHVDKSIMPSLCYLNRACFLGNREDLRQVVSDFQDKFAANDASLKSAMHMWSLAVEWAHSPYPHGSKNALVNATLAWAQSQQMKAACAIAEQEADLKKRSEQIAHEEKKLHDREITHAWIVQNYNALKERENDLKIREAKIKEKEQETTRLQTLALQSANDAKKLLTQALHAFELYRQVRTNKTHATCEGEVTFNNVLQGISSYLPLETLKNREPEFTCSKKPSKEIILALTGAKNAENTIKTWIHHGIVDVCQSEIDIIRRWAVEYGFKKLAQRLEILHIARESESGNTLVITYVPENWWRLARRYVLTDSDIPIGELKIDAIDKKLLSEPVPKAVYEAIIKEKPSKRYPENEFYHFAVDFKTCMNNLKNLKLTSCLKDESTEIREYFKYKTTQQSCIAAKQSHEDLLKQLEEAAKS